MPWGDDSAGILTVPLTLPELLVVTCAESCCIRGVARNKILKEARPTILQENIILLRGNHPGLRFSIPTGWRNTIPISLLPITRARQLADFERVGPDPRFA